MANKKKTKRATGARRAAKKKKKNLKRAATTRAPKKQASRKRKKKTSSKVTRSKKRIATGSRSRQAPDRIYTHREGVTFQPEKAGLRSGGQAGDLEALPDTEGPDSESVDELLEEGNTFEAEAVAGVERAEDEEGREVHTHEVPEDDVPEEYLDKDS